jgi:hypothetical protein
MNDANRKCGGRSGEMRGRCLFAVSASTRAVRAAARLAVAAALALGCGTAFADEDGSHWTPALRVGVGVHSQGLDGSVLGLDALPPLQMPSGVPDDPNTPAMEDFDVSTPGRPGDSATTIEFRFGLRLYAPDDLLPIEDKYRPRLFVSAGAEMPLDDGFVATRYDNNFDVTVPALYGAGLTVADFCPEVGTQACTYSARVKFDIVANWSFGFGADFTLPVFERQFHLVPFVEYFGQAYESDGWFNLKLAASQTSDDARRIQSSSDTEFLHGIGAGLGFEVDVFEGDRISTRLFLETRAAWILNDRETKYYGTNPVPTANFNTAEFQIRPSGFVVTTAAGVEFRWTGWKDRKDRKAR